MWFDLGDGVVAFLFPFEGLVEELVSFPFFPFFGFAILMVLPTYLRL